MSAHANRPPSPTQALTIASHLQRDCASPVLCHGTDKEAIQLGSTHIYVAKFPDDVTWAIRFPVHAHGSLPPSGISSIVQAEIDVLSKLDQVGFSWSPKLIAGDATFGNLVGSPYLVVTWIPGTALQWTAELPAEKRQRILHQLTEIQLELTDRTQQVGYAFDDYLVNSVNHNIDRVLNGQLPEADLRSYFVHRILARHAVDDAFDQSTFAVSHGNLKAHKIIVDDEGNIAGIIDWKLARPRPLQMALQFPELLRMCPNATDSIETVHPSPDLLSDRQVVTSHLSSLTSQSKTRRPDDHLSLAQEMKTVTSNPSVDWRALVLDSCFSKGLHSWMAKNSWMIDDTQFHKPAGVRTPSDEDITKEVDIFACHESGSGLSREELLVRCEERK